MNARLHLTYQMPRIGIVGMSADLGAHLDTLVPAGVRHLSFGHRA